MLSLPGILKSNKFVLITVFLLILNFCSSLTVIYLRHLNRISMIELQSHIDKQDVLYKEWTQLLLEQSTLASYNRVDQVARNQLGMKLPINKEISILELN